MFRSSSTANISTKIQFDPKQFKTGSSSIDKLPIRKTSSMKSLSRNQSKCSVESRKSTKMKINKNTNEQTNRIQYQIDLLQRMNQSLERENVYLKKQLQFYTVKNGKVANESTQRERNKDKILMRINKNSERVTQQRQSQNKKQHNQDETGYGLINSKMSTPIKSLEETIRETFDKYQTMFKLPSLQTLNSLMDNYLSSIRQNYYKLKILLQKVKSSEGKIQNRKQLLKKVTNNLHLLEMPIIYSKIPKTGRKFFQQQADPTLNSQDICFELCSPQQITQTFDNICKLMLKNPKMIEKMHSCISLQRLIKRIRQ